VPIRILIVDDSQVVRTSLRRMFDQVNGWEVCGEADNGKVALAIAEECHPDIVLLDLSMPEMNGLEAARELKRKNVLLPVVLYTTFCTPQLTGEAMAAGCSAVASKMGSSEDLMKKMRLLVGAAA